MNAKCSLHLYQEPSFKEVDLVPLHMAVKKYVSRATKQDVGSGKIGIF